MPDELTDTWLWACQCGTGGVLVVVVPVDAGDGAEDVAQDAASAHLREHLDRPDIHVVHAGRAVSRAGVEPVVSWRKA